MAFLSEAEVRNIIREELAASPDLVDLTGKSIATWIEEDVSAAAAAVTVTHAAEADKSHYVVGVIATYGEAAAAGLLELSEGATVKISGYAKDTVPLVILLPKPYKAAENKAV